jgi:hypothetical protein
VVDYEVNISNDSEKTMVLTMIKPVLESLLISDPENIIMLGIWSKKKT